MTGQTVQAEEAKNFVFQNYIGLLSTHSAQNPGFPFGSLVKYCPDTDGDIIIHISLIAEHYKNLTVNSKASLFVYDPFSFQNPLQYSRATLLLDFSSALKEESDTAERRSIYCSRFPSDIPPEIEGNFRYVCGRIERVRWIQGFGQMGWVSADQYASADVDPISIVAPEIISHINEDHSNAVSELALYYSKDSKRPFVMSGVSSKGIFIRSISGGEKDLFIAFDSAASTTEEVRTSIIQLLQKIRAK